MSSRGAQGKTLSLPYTQRKTLDSSPKKALSLDIKLQLTAEWPSCVLIRFQGNKGPGNRRRPTSDEI